MNENQLNRRIGLSAKVFVLYSAYYISGYSSALHNYIIVSMFILWNIIAAIEDKKAYSFALGCKAFVAILLFVTYYFITSLIHGGVVYTLEYVIIFLCLYCVTIQYRYYFFRNRYHENFFIIKWQLIAFVVFSVFAIIFYLLNPSAARVLAANYYAFDSIAIGGGYSIAIGASILCVYILELILRKQNLSKRAHTIFIVLFFLFEYLIIKTESTTTLISGIVGIIAAVIFYSVYKDSKNTIRTIAIGFGLIVVLVIIVLNLNAIGRFIVDITQNGGDNVLIRRFNRIGQKMLYSGREQGYTNYVDERLGTIRISWNTFIHNPIFGVGYQCGNVYSQLKSVGVGLHSEMFDVLAEHGMIGFIIWFSFIRHGLKNQINHNKCNGWKIAFLMLLIFNPFRTYHGYLASFYIIPMYQHLLESHNTTSIEEE